MDYSNIEYWERHPALLDKRKAYILDEIFRIAKTRDDQGVRDAIASGTAPFSWNFTLDESSVSEEDRALFYSSEYPQHRHSYSSFKDGVLLFTVSIKK